MEEQRVPRLVFSHICWLRSYKHVAAAWQSCDGAIANQNSGLLLCCAIRVQHHKVQAIEAAFGVRSCGCATCTSRSRNKRQRPSVLLRCRCHEVPKCQVCHRKQPGTQLPAHGSNALAACSPSHSSRKKQSSCEELSDTHAVDPRDNAGKRPVDAALRMALLLSVREEVTWPSWARLYVACINFHAPLSWGWIESRHCASLKWALQSSPSILYC